MQRVFYSYARLFIASWIFMGGLALQFIPSPAAVAREARWRERQLESIPKDKHAQWIEDRDEVEATHQAYVRLLGVGLGGLGFAAALRETAYINSRYSR